MEKNVIVNNNVEFTITETETRVVVEAEIPRRETVRDPKIRCGTDDVKKILDLEGITISASSSTVSLNLTNSKNEKLSGRWVFEKPKTRKTRKKSIRERTKAIANRRREEPRQDKLLGNEGME